MNENNPGKVCRESSFISSAKMVCKIGRLNNKQIRLLKLYKNIIRKLYCKIAAKRRRSLRFLEVALPVIRTGN